MFCKNINICKYILLVLVCLKIRVICVYLTFVHLKVFGDIDHQQKQPNDFAYFRHSNASNLYGFETKETLGKYHYMPDVRSRRKLYLWKTGKIHHVKDSSVLRKAFMNILNAESEIINPIECTTNVTSTPNVTSKNYLKSPNCTEIRKELDEFSNFVFKEEIDVRIAYSILVYKDYEMLELLLRTIYKPQNTYCIHIDDKSPIDFKQRVRRLAGCFENNIFIAKNLVKVYWSTFSVMSAEMSCMNDLINKSKSWKYFINLTGQEFPLRTNYEIAKILNALNGYNNIQCIARFRKHRLLLISGHPPYNLTAYKSSAHVVLTRSFVEYFLQNDTVKTVLNWAKKTLVPDEIAFPTIHCNRKLMAPGSFGASGYRHTRNSITRFKVWVNNTSFDCHGHRLRGICIFGPKNLPILKKRHELFANKFLIREYPQVPYCLRKTLLERTYLEYTGRLDYNISLYENI